MLTLQDYEEVLQSHRELVRELDIAISGIRGAAKQASLCDLIEPARKLRIALIRIANATKPRSEHDWDTAFGQIYKIAAEAIGEWP